MSALTMVILAALGSLVIRSALVTALAGVTIGPRVGRGLRLVAPSVLAGLVAQTLLIQESMSESMGGSTGELVGESTGELLFRSLGSWHIAAAMAALVAWRTRSVAITLAVGMTAVWLLELV